MTISSSRIQDLDGGFFEKFGSLLRQKSLIAEGHIATPLASLSEQEPPTEGEEHLRTIEEGENDSGTETLQDTDSEHEDLLEQSKKQEEMIEEFSGWNVSFCSISSTGANP